mmetsp:Transcript_27319/g.49381  ORF Transcript_27319/g.49381 Transcript_27319/m.49381 type:complete len:215 (-) Transcript_27319:700-1344(-)
MMLLYPPSPVPAHSWSTSSRTRSECVISLASVKRSTRAAALASSPPPLSDDSTSRAVTKRTYSDDPFADACAAAHAARAVAPAPPLPPAPTRRRDCSRGVSECIGAVNRSRSRVILFMEELYVLIPNGNLIRSISSCLPSAGRTSLRACFRSASVTIPALFLSSNSTVLARAKLAALRTNPASSAPEKCSVFCARPFSPKSSIHSSAVELSPPA